MVEILLLLRKGKTLLGGVLVAGILQIAMKAQHGGVRALWWFIYYTLYDLDLLESVAITEQVTHLS